MLTLFTTAKPNRGHFGIIQKNAIQSWLRLCPTPEIVLFGNDEGASELAEELGILHISKVACNEFGTPLISSMFETAQNVSANRLVAYVNSDIILIGNFIDTISRIQKPLFLIVGQRHDLDIDSKLNFNDSEWKSRLQSNCLSRGIPHNKTGIDYFIFSKGTFKEIPPFAIGRTSWDNWLVYAARATGVPVIDATNSIMAIHQNHDYSHRLHNNDSVWYGPEAKHNLSLAGGTDHLFDIKDANYMLEDNRLKYALSLVHIWRYFVRLPVLYPHFGFLSKFFDLLSKFANLIRKIKHRI